MDHATTVLHAVRNRRRGGNRKLPTPFDRRTRVGRRTAELVALFRQRVGADVASDPVATVAIERAAQLTALAEAASARALRADPKISLDDVVRLSRAADLAVRRLLDRREVKPAAPSLAEYLSRGEVSP
jgi:hypothetical protein